MSLRAKKIITIVLAVLLAVGVFFGGFGTRCAVEDKSLTTLDWALRTIEKEYYYEVDGSDVLHYGLKGLTGNVLDIYSAYYTKEEYQKVTNSNAGRKTGIGVTSYFVDNFLGKGVCVESVVFNSPAYRAGVTSGTIIKSGKFGNDERTFTSVSDFMNFIDVIPNEEVFSLYSDGKTFELSKQAYTASYCFMATPNTAYDCVYNSGMLSVIEVEEKAYSFLPEDTAYLALTQFYGNATPEMARLVEKFNATSCKNLILDLRNNGGGYVDVLQSLAYIFKDVATGNDPDLVLQAQYKDGKKELYKRNKWSSPAYLKEGTTVYVLANLNTASASEALIGYLVSNNIVKLENVYISDLSQTYLDHFGGSAKNGKTYGKGIMQSTFVRKSSGEALKLTTAKILWPNGTCIHGTGLSEDMGCKKVSANWTVLGDHYELKNMLSLAFN